MTWGFESLRMGNNGTDERSGGNVREEGNESGCDLEVETPTPHWNECSSHSGTAGGAVARSGAPCATIPAKTRCCCRPSCSISACRRSIASRVAWVRMYPRERKSIKKNTAVTPTVIATMAGEGSERGRTSTRAFVPMEREKASLLQSAAVCEADDTWIAAVARALAWHSGRSRTQRGEERRIVCEGGKVIVGGIQVEHERGAVRSPNDLEGALVAAGSG